MIDALEGASGQIIVVGAFAAPLLAAAALALSRSPRARARAEAGAVASSVPALAAAAAVPSGEIELPWLLLGTHLQLDPLARGILGLTGLVWLLAGFYGLSYLGTSRHKSEFFIAYALALAGAAGTALAADVISLYAAFSIMSLASYVFVVSARHREAMRAGRVYIALAIGGDLLLLAGVATVVAELGAVRLAAAPAAVAGADHPEVVAALLFFGFGVKAGALGVHMWLPLAYTAAPTPATALLGGALLNLGLLGWLRVLPLGWAALPALGGWAAASGLVAAYGAALIGAVQRDAKTVLAYSSLSQIGLVTAVLGVVLLRPERAEDGILAAGIFAVHHGLAKLALFLGVGVARAPLGRVARSLATGGLFFAAAAMVGVPLTTGAVAKKALKDAVPADGELGFELIHAALAASPAATLFVLFAFFIRTGEEAGSGRPATAPMLAAYGAAVVALASGVLLLPGIGLASLLRDTLAPAEIGSALWPLAVGALACGIAVFAVGRLGRVPIVPAGDVLGWLGPAWYRIKALAVRSVAAGARGAARAAARGSGSARRAGAVLARGFAAERTLAAFTAGSLAALLLALIFAALAGRP